jgi:hypothetical protein
VRARIDTRFADSRAADLSLAYGLRPLPALGTHTVALPGLTLSLRVLGASHQVVVGDWSETVACLPDRPGALPASEETVVGDFVVRFRAECLRPTDFAERVGRIVTDCAADDNAFVGEFPGSPLAVTALSARAHGDGAAWQTWHAYPQVGELVWTSTEVTPR